MHSHSKSLFSMNFYLDLLFVQFSFNHTSLAKSDIKEKRVIKETSSSSYSVVNVSLQNDPNSLNCIGPS